MGQFQSKCFSAKADAVPASSKADSGGVVVEGVPCRQTFASGSSDVEAELLHLRSEVAELKGALAAVLEGNSAPSPSAPAPSAITEDRGEPAGVQYKRVQFIPLLMNSGPCKEGEQARYLGLPNVREDFAARVEFVKLALLRAEKLADKDPEVLKVFSLPEFFFRGPLGAYSLQDTLGDAYHTNSFISQLQELLADERWSHWLGIFGTVIAYQIAPGKKYRLHNVYNICLCQHGGFKNTAERGKKCHFILKHWVSEIDFLDGGKPGDEGMVVFRDEQWLKNHQQHYLDGLRAFGRLQDDCLIRIGGISIGLEICLDHLESRLIENEPTRQYQHDRPIEMQVVISAGMSFNDESMVVSRPGGVAFINDGQGCNDGAVDTRTDGRLYSEAGTYERIAPVCVQAFPELSAEKEKLLGRLYCMHDDAVPTDPLLGIYPVVKVTDYDD